MQSHIKHTQGQVLHSGLVGKHKLDYKFYTDFLNLFWFVLKEKNIKKNLWVIRKDLGYGAGKNMIKLCSMKFSKNN